MFLFIHFFCKSAIPIAKPAKWIKPQTLSVNETIPASEISNGYYYMLSDEQINVEKKHYYCHYAYKIVSEAGVQNASELNFSYNPSYEKFIFHHIKVYRNGTWIDKTHKVSIKEMQRETRLEEHLYDESMSVLVVLDDIRPGDIVEYDYSTIGSNPIFEGKFYYNFMYSYAYELLEVNFRILKPEGRKINEKIRNSDIKPERVLANGQEEIVYHARHIKGLTMENKLPHSYNPYYSIEFSEYDTWQQVGEWAKDVFSATTPNSKLLSDKIKEIEQEFPAKDKQVMAALRFVQDQIRYMGVEIGISSHKPTSPNKVMFQRFGDCKDKALLFCKMLEELGVKAWPALVSTNDRSGIKNSLVSPHVFNHCIAKVELDGKFYWFDPTISYQKGNIEHYYTPNYELAYVIGVDKNELEEMPANSFSKIATEETYQVNDFEGKAVLKVSTTYEGADADAIRSNFANSSSKSMEESLLNYYKTYFPEISTKTPPSIEDDQETDKFILHEEYAIDKFWTYPDSANKKKVAANIYAYMIREKLRAYDATYAKRKMPMYLDYPVDVEQNIHLVLPEDWNINIGDDVRKTEFIEFAYKVKNVKNVIDLELKYKSLTNTIPVAKAQEFVTLLDDLLTNSSGIQITYDKSVTERATDTSVNWLMVVIFVMFLGLFIFLAFYIYRKHPKNKLIDENGHEIKPEAIGGWLVLPVIGLILTPPLCIWTIFKNSYFNLAIWNSLTTSTSTTYHPLWGLGLTSELLLTTFALVFAVLLCFMLFTHDKRFPRYMIAFLAIKVFSELSSTVILNIIQDKELLADSSSLLKMVISAAVWIPYFIRSERCKETFTR